MSKTDFFDELAEELKNVSNIDIDTKSAILDVIAEKKIKEFSKNDTFTMYQSGGVIIIVAN